MGGEGGIKCPLSFVVPRAFFSSSTAAIATTFEGASLYQASLAAFRDPALSSDSQSDYVSGSASGPRVDSQGRPGS